MNTDAEHRSNEMGDADQSALLSDPPLSPTDSHDGNLTPNGAGGSAEKKPVIRGARACSVCRAAKMRCIGGDDQNSHIRPCNRCKKSGVECVFEKHRRGRKPGSKLSDASKLRRQSKDHLPKIEETASGPSLQAPAAQPPPTKVESVFGMEGIETANAGSSARPRGSSFNQKPMVFGPQQGPSAGPATSPQTYPGPYVQPFQEQRYHPGHVDAKSTQGYSMAGPSAPKVKQQATMSPRIQGNPTGGSLSDDDPSEDNLFPAQILAKAKSRQSFLATVLGPSSNSGPRPVPRTRPTPPEPERVWTQQPSWEPPPCSSLPQVFNIQKQPLPDPIDLNILDLAESERLLALVFDSMNPFVNLFDENLHTVSYIRSRSPFLYTVLMAAACKFFKQECFKQLQKMAYVFTSRALDEQWKGVEVIQAFCCMVYWKEPEDNRAWSYIGYACRMAVELGLGGYTPPDSKPETEFQHRERRNRERTYLVLFVHDRSLSMQTGRAWMLPDDELVRNSITWLRDGIPGEKSPQDVIVTAFVQLRRLSAETSDVFYIRKNWSQSRSDVKTDVVLNACNEKLTDWADRWDREMRDADGTEFHLCMLQFFKLHVRLFLNSLGMTGSVQSGSSVSLQALSFCLPSAMETLEIVIRFCEMGVLRYGQDVITVMSAYAAIFLLKLLRRSKSSSSHRANGEAQQEPLLTTEKVHSLIRQAADAFHSAVDGDGPSTTARVHARFLRALVEDEGLRARASEASLGLGEPTDGVMPNTAPGPANPAMQQMGGRYHPPQILPQQPSGSTAVSVPAQYPNPSNPYENARPEISVNTGTGVVPPGPMLASATPVPYYSPPSAHATAGPPNHTTFRQNGPQPYPVQQAPQHFQPPPYPPDFQQQQQFIAQQAADPGPASAAATVMSDPQYTRHMFEQLGIPQGHPPYLDQFGNVISGDQQQRMYPNA